jgi:uncharacterized membrane protein
MTSPWIIYAAAALVLWGASGVTQKLSTNRISSQLSFLWFAAAMVVISAVLAATVPIHWHVSRTILFLSVAGGLLNGLGALTSFSALEAGGKASVVISLISMYPLFTAGLAVVFLHEHLSRVQGVGIVLAIAAAILLSLEAPAVEVGESSR